LARSRVVLPRVARSDARRLHIRLPVRCEIAHVQADPILLREHPSALTIAHNHALDWSRRRRSLADDAVSSSTRRDDVLRLVIL